MSLACSDDYETRDRLGEVVKAAVSARRCLDRRSEHIDWESSDTFTRQVTLEFSLEPFLEQLEIAKLSGDLLPVCLLPKGLFHDIEITRGAGDTAAVASRNLDSRLGQSLLARIGAEESGQSLPNQPVWDLLWRHCYRFPPDDDRFILDPDDQRNWAMAIARSGDLALTGSDLEWWDKACEREAWITWLMRLHRDFLLTARLEPQAVQRHETFRLRWVDTRPGALLGATTRYPTGKNRGSFAYKIPIFDFGRAKSEHVQLHAPPGTFLAAAQLVRHLSRRVLAPRIRASRNRVTIYQGPRDLDAGEDLAIGTCAVELQLWPSSRGFFSLMKSVCTYLLLMLVFLLVVQGFRLATDEEGRSALADDLDSITTLVLFLPSLVLPLLFDRDEHDVRWRLLEGWRSLIKWYFVPVALAYGTFVITPTDKHATDGWLTVFVGFQAFYCVWMTFLRLRIWSDASEVTEAETIAREAERAPAKGTRARLANEAYARSSPTASNRSGTRQATWGR